MFQLGAMRKLLMVENDRGSLGTPDENIDFNAAIWISADSNARAR